jgi:hypothetical protein
MPASVETTIGRAILDGDIAAFDIARLFEALPNSVNQSVI